MNARSTTGLVFMFIGVALVYAAASGNLQSAWKGLKGDCKSASGTPAAVSQGPSSSQPPAKAGDVLAAGGLGDGGYTYVNADGRIWAGNHGGLT